MRTYPLSHEDLRKTLDGYLMEARVELNQALSRGLSLVLDNAKALDERSRWKSASPEPPPPGVLVLIAYRYRVDTSWRFEVGRLSNETVDGHFWVRNDDEYIHELPGTWWRELVGPSENAGPATEPPGVVTEVPGVVTEPPGVVTEVPGVVTEPPGVSTVAKTQVPGLGTLSIRVGSSRPIGARS